MQCTLSESLEQAPLLLPAKIKEIRFPLENVVSECSQLLQSCVVTCVCTDVRVINSFCCTVWLSTAKHAVVEMQ